MPPKTSISCDRKIGGDHATEKGSAPKSSHSSCSNLWSFSLPYPWQVTTNPLPLASVQRDSTKRNNPPSGKLLIFSCCLHTALPQKRHFSWKRRQFVSIGYTESSKYPPNVRVADSTPPLAPPAFADSQAQKEQTIQGHILKVASTRPPSRIPTEMNPDGQYPT